MSSFADMLAKQKPQGTVKFPLEMITLGGEESPVLEMRYAGRSNCGYQSAIIKVANERRNRGATGKITAAKLAADTELDARLFAQHVIVGWEHVYEHGKPVSFTPQKCEELLLELAEHRHDIFLAITTFARDAENFRDVGATAGVELGKP